MLADPDREHRSRGSPRTRVCSRRSPSQADCPSSASTCRSHKGSSPMRLTGFTRQRRRDARRDVHRRPLRGPPSRDRSDPRRVRRSGLRRVDDPFRCIWVFLRGRSALAQGRLGIALPTLREAAAVLRRRDPGGMLGWCLASLAQACGATGDARGARAAVAEFDEVHPAVMRNIDAEIGLGRAWAEAAAGKRTEAVARALATAEAIVDRGDAAVGVFVLHDALRLGASPRLVTSLMAGPTGRSRRPGRRCDGGPRVGVGERGPRRSAARCRRARLGLDAVARSRSVCCRVSGRGGERPSGAAA